MNLTKREIEILYHVAQGMTNQQIAAELGIAKTTVKAHLKSVFEKLKQNSRLNAVINAVNNGIIDINKLQK